MNCPTCGKVVYLAAAHRGLRNTMTRQKRLQQLVNVFTSERRVFGMLPEEIA